MSLRLPNARSTLPKHAAVRVDGERCLNRDANSSKTYHGRKQTVMDHIKADKLGILMRVAVNELDLNFEGMNEDIATDLGNEEGGYLVRIGVTRIIKMALQTHEKFDAPTVYVEAKSGVFAVRSRTYQSGWDQSSMVEGWLKALQRPPASKSQSWRTVFRLSLKVRSSTASITSASLFKSVE